MKKYTQEELKEIVKRHKMWLNGEDGGERANLQRVDLQDADLRDADLRGTNLRGVDLWDANLQDADLRDANLRDANLQDADLRGVDLRNVDLRDANLQDADLREAKLQGASLQGAILPKGVWQIAGPGCVGRCTTYDSINDQVVCGCWDDDNGNHLEAFKRRVENIYGEDGKKPNKKYYNEYATAIAFFETVKNW